MSETTAKKLNMHSVSVPVAFLGKERDRELGSNKFLTKVGKKRLRANTIMSLGLMYTQSIMFGNLNLMSYSAFTDALYISRPSVCSSLKETIGNKIVNKIRQSKYEIAVEYSDERTITVYSFLLEETFDLGGTVRKLTTNEAIYVSILIAYYLNEYKKDKYFVGGVRRVASTLNVSESTAWYIIDRLIHTKIIYRKALTVDSAGNQMINEGKGSSREERTVYEVNSKILARCRKIENENAKQRAVKKLFKQTPKKPDKKQGFKYNKYTFADSVTDSKEFKKLCAAFDSDETVIELKQRYRSVEALYLEALRSGDEAEEYELEDELDEIKSELREYLITSGAPPEAIPKNIIEYIKN